MPRIIAIGDVHGCSDALERVLTEIQPEREDLIVGLGDFVDRGPNSAGVIEILLELVTQCHHSSDRQSRTDDVQRLAGSDGIQFLVPARWQPDRRQLRGQAPEHPAAPSDFPQSLPAFL